MYVACYLIISSPNVDIVLSDLLAKGHAQKSLLKKKAVDKEHVLSACIHPASLSFL